MSVEFNSKNGILHSRDRYIFWQDNEEVDYCLATCSSAETASCLVKMLNSKSEQQNPYLVNILTIPSKLMLEALIGDAKACLEYYDTGGQLTYDHLENSIADILGLRKPNPELSGN